MRPDPVEEAISEQVQGFILEPGIEKGIKGKRLRRVQIYKKRRKTEIILNEMVDKLRLSKQSEPRKRTRKRRRRGSRVLVARAID
jgi:hypothetical protein